VIIKIRYRVDEYLMAGSQFGFNFSTIDPEELLLRSNELNDTVLGRLNLLFDEYKLTDDEVVHIMLTFRKIDLKFLSDIQCDSEEFLT